MVSVEADSASITTNLKSTIVPDKKGRQGKERPGMFPPVQRFPGLCVIWRTG
jgi:hypothetical protein